MPPERDPHPIAAVRTAHRWLLALVTSRGINVTAWLIAAEVTMASHETRVGQAAPMQGCGFYNRHAQLQASGGAVGLGLLSQAIDDLQSLEQPLTIADFGCAQGRNSLPP